MTDHIEHDEPTPLRVIGGVDTHKEVHVAAVLDELGWLLDTASFDVETLQTRLRSAHADCLPADMRALFLGESVGKAHRAYATCERSHQRTPPEEKRP